MIKIKESMMSTSAMPGFKAVEKIIYSKDFLEFVENLYRRDYMAIVPDISMAINYFSRSAVAQPVTTESNDVAYIMLNNKLYDVYNGEYILKENIGQNFLRGSYKLSENYAKLVRRMDEQIRYEILNIQQNSGVK